MRWRRRISWKLPLPAAMDESSARGDVSKWRETKRRLDATGIRLIEAKAAVLLPGGDLAQWRPYLEAAALLGAAGVTPCFFGDWETAALD